MIVRRSTPGYQPICVKPANAKSIRALWVAGLAVLGVGLVWFTFHAYLHPELLIGMVNLRYCN